MFFRHSFNFKTEGGIDGLNFAAAIDGGSALKQIAKETLIGLIQNQPACLLFEISTILHLDHVKLLALDLAESADNGQAEFVNGLVGGRAFLLQIALEFFHILRLHTEYGQRFKKRNILGRLYACIQHTRRTLQATFITFQSNTASE